MAEKLRKKEQVCSVRKIRLPCMPGRYKMAGSRFKYFYSIQILTNRGIVILICSVAGLPGGVGTSRCR